MEVELTFHNCSEEDGCWWIACFDRGWWLARSHAVSLSLSESLLPVDRASAGKVRSLRTKRQQHCY